MPLPFTKRSGADPDALAYFASAGIASAAVTPTAYDNAASFNGTNQFLSVASNSSLQSGGTSFSISAWVNLVTNDLRQIFVGKDDVTGREYLLGYSISGGSSLRFAFGASAGLNIEVPASSFGQPSLNQWYHLVGTYDGTNQRIYVNGTLQGTLASAAPTSTGSTFTIGRRVYTGFNDPTNGRITGVGFWKRTLSAGDVTSLYNGGLGLTYSGIQGAGLTTNLSSYWALNQTSVTADSAGSNTLTNNDSVTASIQGPIATSTASSRTLINNFVKGVKSLGLWNSMVCWPLRSSQNANGTTPYSLGGLYTASSDLVQGGGAFPTWNANGLIFNNTSQQMTVTYNDIFKNILSSYVAFSCGSTAQNNRHSDIQNGSASGIYIQHKFDGSSGFGSAGVYGNTTRSGGNSFPNQSPSRPINLTTFQSSAYSIGSTFDTTYQDGSIALSGYQTGKPVPNATGTPAVLLHSNSSNKIAAFSGLFNSTLTDANNTALNIIYKQTLGLGLGMP